MPPHHTANVKQVIERIRNGESQADRVAWADAMLRRCLWIAACDAVDGRPSATAEAPHKRRAGDGVVRLPVDRAGPPPFERRQAA